MIYGFSPQVVPPPADWGESVHVTGYWFPEDGDWKPPPDLLAFIETSPPPLFIGFGSMPVADAGSTTQLILEAVKRTNQRCVLHTGWAGIGDQPLPDYIYKIQYAPYGWLFPRMAMVIHHGGSGTTAFGLRAGVPSLAVHMLFDQFFWGERIAALGVGPPPIPFRKLTAERLAQAIEFAISDKQMRQRAAELGKKIQAENGIDKAIKIIQDTINP
jgi:UDP:flavonoid glycosyltransferase YjiC (YdhE family)